MKAEEIAEKEFLINYDYHSFKDSYIDGFIKGYNYDKWIKCSEQMPDEEIVGDKVLLKRDVNTSQLSLAVTIHDTKMVKYCDLESTYWHPLPSNPKEL